MYRIGLAAILPGLALAFGALGCGLVGVGPGIAPNDPLPSGVIVAQGNFASLNGKSVSGVVSVYQSDCGASYCTFTLRLQNLSAPQDTTLDVVPRINSTEPQPWYQLRATSGTQNYVYTSVAAGANWSQVALRPSSYPQGNYDYGVATLQPVSVSH